MCLGFFALFKLTTNIDLSFDGIGGNIDLFRPEAFQNNFNHLSSMFTYNLF